MMKVNKKPVNPATTSSTMPGYIAACRTSPITWSIHSRYFFIVSRISGSLSLMTPAWTTLMKWASNTSGKRASASCNSMPDSMCCWSLLITTRKSLSVQSSAVACSACTSGTPARIWNVSRVQKSTSSRRLTFFPNPGTANLAFLGAAPVSVLASAFCALRFSSDSASQRPRALSFLCRSDSSMAGMLPLRWRPCLSMAW